jgi:hypothetical protein
MRASIPHGQHDEANDEEDTGCRGSDSRSSRCSGGELAYRERVQDGRHGGSKAKSNCLVFSRVELQTFVNNGGFVKMAEGQARGSGRWALLLKRWEK